jgi:hypothetical protein
MKRSQRGGESQASPALLRMAGTVLQVIRAAEK